MEIRTVIYIAVIYFLTNVKAQGDSPAEWRLPEYATPTHYEVELTIPDEFWKTKRFTGKTTITFGVDGDHDEIVLHSANLTIEANNDYTTSYVEKTEKLTVKFKESLKQDADNEVTFEYSGVLHEDMYGFYLSDYTVEGKEEPEYIATTQFEATYARRAFPCFDEPAFKATFNFILKYPTDYRSLFNTELINSATVDGLKVDVYKQTPVMSTYLIAFVISKFKGYAETHDTDNKKSDVFCQENALSTAQYSYSIADEILQQLSTWTDFDYYSRLNKMHQVAIPDFAAGAMENWGLVTYRETALLWDPEQSTANNKQRIALVIAHEFAHQWFGNLVTLNWWSYTWLNEGFARYLQYYILKDLDNFRSWELDKQFVVEQIQTILVTDAISSAFALNSEVLTPTQISDKFASISYSKGASIIRMVTLITGDDNFKTGIRNYLSTNADANAVPSNLWASLSAHVSNDRLPEGVSLETVMSGWTDEAGFPLVTVTMLGPDAILEQKHFLYNQSKVTNLQWDVPITYTTSHGINFNDDKIVWLEPNRNVNLTNILHGDKGWIVVNLKQMGYYRVNYDDTLWNELEKYLKDASSFKNIDVLNRAQIVDDLFNLARAGVIKYDRALDVTSYLENEVEYYPWFAAFNGFSYIRRRRGDSEQLQKHITKMMDQLYKSVSFDISSSTNHVQILKTSTTLEWACSLEVVGCTTKANELFKAFKSDPTKQINPNIRSTVYCSALRQSNDSSDWEFLWNRYLSENLASEKVLILSALGCTRNETLLNDYLLKSIDVSSGIKKQDARSVFTSVLNGNYGGVNVAYEFFKNQLNAISEYYSGMNDLSNIVNSIAERFTTEAQVDDFEKFVNDNRDHLNEAIEQIENAIENARANLAWAKDDLDNWLKDTYGSAASVTVSFTLFLSVLVTAVYNFM